MRIYCNIDIIYAYTYTYKVHMHVYIKRERETEIETDRERQREVVRVGQVIIEEKRMYKEFCKFAVKVTKILKSMSFE